MNIQDHLSQPTAPFYTGFTIDSLHVESTSQTWKPRPRPRGDLDSKTDVTRDGESKDTGEDRPGEFSTGASVKKVVQLNGLAAYWNPADYGNPCSMHLSDIPVEQAQVILTRQVTDYVGTLRGEKTGSSTTFRFILSWLKSGSDGKT